MAFTIVKDGNSFHKLSQNNTINKITRSLKKYTNFYLNIIVIIIAPAVALWHFDKNIYSLRLRHAYGIGTWRNTVQVSLSVSRLVPGGCVKINIPRWSNRGEPCSDQSTAKVTYITICYCYSFFIDTYTCVFLIRKALFTIS